MCRAVRGLTDLCDGFCVIAEEDWVEEVGSLSSTLEILNKEYIHFGQGLDFLKLSRGKSRNIRWTNEEHSRRKLEIQALSSY